MSPVVQRVKKIIATLKRKITTALIYPTILILLSLGLMSIIVLKVVPAFTDYYRDFGAQLPFFTRVIFNVSAFLRDNTLEYLDGSIQHEYRQRIAPSASITSVNRSLQHASPLLRS